MSAFAPRSSELGLLVLGGVVIIGLAGVGMTFIKGNYITDSTVKTEREGRLTELEEGEVKIRRLKAKLIDQKAIMLEKTKQRRESELRSAKKGIFDAELEKFRKENTALAAHKRSLAGDLEDLAEEKKAYREATRKRIWTAWVDRELGQESFVRPLPYKNIRVSRVEASGLVVKHSSGIDRVEVAELTPEVRVQLDLNLVEARREVARLEKESSLQLRNRERARRNEIVKQQPTRQEMEELVSERLAEGKKKVTSLLFSLNQTEVDARNAWIQHQTSKSRSAPGSLETWKERAMRLDRKAAKYRNGLDAMIAEIRQIEPDYRPPGY